MRPDHGRMIWGERGRPGYGLYDRALGATYLQGLWEGLSRSSDRNRKAKQTDADRANETHQSDKPLKSQQN